MSEDATAKATATKDGSRPSIVLASASQARRRLLVNAGLLVDIEPARIDEQEVKDALKAEGAGPAQVAETLAELKAQRVSRHRPGALVVGADQILECNGVWFDKPSDRAQAASHLRALSGKEHRLICGVCVVRDGTRLWHHNEQARLTLRPLSDDFIDTYLSALGELALTSVGVYQLEGLGAQLFSKIEGDYFTILGLSLLPLLAFLRDHEVIGA